MSTEVLDVNNETNDASNIPEKYRNRTLINSKYIFEKKIGSGSFGTVYRGRNIISGHGVAIKFEATTANIPTLLWESKIMNHLVGTPGVVKLRYFGTESNKNIIVMDLFSHTLCEEITRVKKENTNTTTTTTQNNEVNDSSKESASSPTEADFEGGIEQKEEKEQTVKYSSSNNSDGVANTDMSDVSALMRLVEPKKTYTSSSENPIQLPGIPVHIIVVAKYLISMIEIIARVHEAGIVHRDIKPDNFMVSVVGNTGESDNTSSSSSGSSGEKKLNIIDFGLSRFYMKGDKHVDNTNDRSVVGTVRYISKHVHEGNVYSRRDDIISILYVAIYLAKGSLPWMGVTIKKGDTVTKEDMVYNIKDRTTSTELCEGIPYLFKKLLDYSYSLSFEDKPDYSYMTRQCKNYLKIYV
jgi:serine/threonine protein kinase